MTLVSTRLVPELQYYFNQFVVNSTMNKRLFPIPAPLRIEYFDENRSFIRMLFDSTWRYEYYQYKYILVDSKGSWPLEVQTRLNIYPTAGQYYIPSDSTAAINLFQLQSDDFVLLDRLSHFRRHPAHSSVSGIDYTLLSTNLSKLIYIYLDILIDGHYYLYNNTTLISDPTMPLECCYEAYVAETLFNVTSAKNVVLE